MIHKALRQAAMTLGPLRRIVEQRNAAQARVAHLERQLKLVGTTCAQGREALYTTLPGTEYARYTLPLDYMPSRDLRPRWGEAVGPIAPIAEWLAESDLDYRRVLHAMTERKSMLARIPMEFSPDSPEPAWLGVPFAAFDSAALYTLIGMYRPRCYLEIGSGISTTFARRSVLDHGLSTRIVSIDPDPRAAIDQICDEVIRKGLENCEMERFSALQANDIVFLDGSHRVFMNSDVTVFMIDVLPRLAPGVLVHIHDIALPWDYPDMFIHYYWSEAYIVAAYLIGARERVKPVFPTSWICRRPEFASWYSPPLVDLGTHNDSWRGGGSMWFTHMR